MRFRTLIATIVGRLRKLFAPRGATNQDLERLRRGVAQRGTTEAGLPPMPHQGDHQGSW